MTWSFPDRPSTNSALPGFSNVNTSSFADLLRRQSPELLPASLGGRGGQSGGDAGQLPHGTTIVALKCPGGVLLAGDRRSTQGNMIAGRDVKKVYITDDYTATGIAGTAAIAVEFARLYAVELEHYEKLEGVPLTFAGKVNRLAIMVRGNLAAAMQGLVALPLLVGYDTHVADPESAGRIVSFDAAGGWNIEEEGYQSVGSGSIFDKEVVCPSHRSRFCTAGSRGGAVRRRRRRFRHRWTRSGSRHLSHGGRHRRRRGDRRAGEPHRGTGSGGHPKPLARRYFRPRWR